MTQFYFLRHGQTEDNRLNRIPKERDDISINETGRAQATQAKRLLDRVPIQSCAVSPKVRAIETHDIVAENRGWATHVIDEFSECTWSIWKAMARFKLTDEVEAFFKRVEQGVEKALTLDGPLLIVAHGGIYWAVCHLFGLKTELIGNCVPVHFSFTSEWTHRPLSHPGHPG